MYPMNGLEHFQTGIVFAINFVKYICTQKICAEYLSTQNKIVLEESIRLVDFSPKENDFFMTFSTHPYIEHFDVISKYNS
jgi:O-glycosyl hydrolase